MGEVVGFPEKDDRIFICDCGCSTFYVHDDWLECAACEVGAVESGGVLYGSWDLRGSSSPQDQQTIIRDFSYTEGGDELAFRRVQKSVMDDGIVAVALFYDSGRVRSVGEQAETEERREWYRRQVDIFLEDRNVKCR